MSGRTKCYDMAPLLAAELMDALRSHVEADGVVDARESHLLGLANGVYAQTEVVSKRVKKSLRDLGGGYADRNLVAQARDLLRFCLEREEPAEVTRSLHRVGPVEALDERQAA